MWSLADDAKAMVIIPQSIRGAFMFGASGGDAVLVARNKDGSWSQPTFMTIGAASFGFQAGGEVSEIILLVMSQRGMEHLLSTTVKLGGDISVAAGPIGAGAKAQTTDILAFSRARGLYGGVSLEGAVLKTRHKFNRGYYGADVTPSDIIYRNEAYNAQSATLQNAAWRLANRDAPANLAPAVGPVGPTSAAPAATQAPAPTILQPIEPGATVAPAPQPGAFEDDAVWGAPIGGKPVN